MTGPRRRCRTGLGIHRKGWLRATRKLAERVGRMGRRRGGRRDCRARENGRCRRRARRSRTKLADRAWRVDRAWHAAWFDSYAAIVEAIECLTRREECEQL